MRAFALLALLSACAPLETGGRVLYVAPPADGELDDPGMAISGGSRFTTIQDAIDAATSGDTVSIPSGSYTETLTLASGVNLDGAGQGQTWIYGTATLASGSVNISGVSMVNPDYVSSGTRYTNYGVAVTGGALTLEDVGLHYYLYGTYGTGGSIVLSDTLLSYNWYGAVANGTTSFTVLNSLVGSNAAGGLAVQASTATNIEYNTFVANAFSATATYLVGAVALGTTTDASTNIVVNNIVTSNYYGLDCHGCVATMGGNLVWGNTTNYINDASADSHDISGDPGFRNASEGDFGITASSICVDAAWASYTTTIDADGESRPQGGGPDIGMDEYATSDYELVITEVMANAAAESTGEFVEIYNAGTSSVDLAGFLLTDGDERDTLEAYGSSVTTLAGGAYAVVIDPEYASNYTIPVGVTLLTTGDTEVGNGLTTSDHVTLYETDGTTIAASFSYPRDPGDGVSMEAYDVAVGDASGNWRSSQCTSGSSPGEEHCFPEAGDPADLVITEVLANATSESTGEYVEIWNSGTSEIDLAGLMIADSNSTDTIEAFNGGSTLIGAGEHAIIVDSGYTYEYYLPSDALLVTTDDATIGNGLSTSDSVTLYDTDGTTLIDTFSYPTDPGDGYSVEKIDYALGDISANWASATTSCTRGLSPGRYNGAAGGTCAVLYINEVMSNPLDEDTGEFIEIYNAGQDSVDLAGLLITDGAQTDTIAAYASGSTTLAAGGWALIVDVEYAGEYTIDASVVMVTTADGTLGNALAVADTIELLEADGENVIDVYQWPLNAGNGFSVERSAYAGVDDAADWTASTCASGSSPGSTNCTSSGGSSATESTYDLVISEVMANPLDESTGEFVEIYNAGSTSIDLLYMVIWDGDALDTIFGYTSLYDTILDPGEYAVVLDSNYAGEYTIPSAALLLTADDATIGSGLSTDDAVYLYEAGGSALIDSYTFPTNPGNGTSVEKVDLDAGDLSTNWSASICSAGSSPGSATCP